MMVLRSRRKHILLAFVYVLLCLGTVAVAKSDQTDSPTMAPTEEEKEKDKNKDKDDDKLEAGEEEEEVKTKKPSDPPTAAPTKYPTYSPTDYPTEWPTYSPTDFPTYAPTMNPTTEEPTDSPVVPSVPDESPQEETKNLVEVRVAPIVVDLVAGDGGSVDASTLLNDFETILNTEVLDRVYDSFVNVDLELALMAADALARRLEEGYEANISGKAFFWESNEVPTEQELSEFLFTYFSIYDSGDLTGRLANTNPDITNVQVRTVDGKPVDIRSINAGGNTSSSEGDDSVSTAAIAGLVIGAVALVAAIAAFIWLRIRKDNESVKGSVETEDCDSPSPRGTGSEISLHDDYSVGISSIADSIYTHNSDVLAFKNKKGPIAQASETPLPVSTPAAPEHYDANRLDKIIGSAHDFSSPENLSRRNSFEDVYSENSEEGPPQIANPVSF